MLPSRKWKQLILAIFITMISCCVFANGISTTIPAPSKKSTQKQRAPAKKVAVLGQAMPWFNSIETDGNFDIQIHTSQNNRVRIEKTDQQVESWVEDGILHLILIPPKEEKKLHHAEAEPPMPMEPIRVTVWLPTLQNLDLNGTNAVMGDSIYSEWLNIEGQGQSNIVLRGLLNINKLIIHGASDVSLRWIQSKHLMVRGYDTSQIFLAGTADVLDAKMTDDSNLDAKYLRTQTVLVATSGGAKASVLALDSLNAFASGDSNIYYYRSPKFHLAQTEFMGNVLQLGHWR